MKKIDQLKKINTLAELADILDIKPSSLSFIIYKIPDHKKYSEFKIPKKNGGERVICAPDEKLKSLQKKLSELLSQCIDDINKTKVIHAHISHAYRKKHSIFTNAKAHKNKNIVINLDLNDFFGSINFGRVRGFFIKNRNFNLNEKIATIIAQIACHKNELPQGSPCSPVISNLITHPLDIQLTKLAKNKSLTYTRYSDDLTFSTNRSNLPISIIFPKKNDEYKFVIGRSIESIIYRNGFSINGKKTRLQLKDSRQDVTGLSVNRLINTKLEYRKKARAMAHSLFKDGRYIIGKLKDKDIFGSKNKLLGMLSFIDEPDKQRRIEHIKASKKSALNSRETLFSRFLYYINFIDNERPTIICEGKTDNVYLKCAIRNIAKPYPTLYDKTRKTLNVNFLRINERSSSLLNISGGTGELTQILKCHKIKLKQFDKKPDHPVIILVDNDKGTSSLIKMVTKDTKSASTGEPFYRYSHNLYLVPIPKINNKDTDIENYFDDELLKTKVGGKQFCRTPRTDTQYGKEILAARVVTPNQKTINFNLFSAILDRVTLAIEDYKNFT